METKTVLMLGATGTLGRPVARCLVARGHVVRAMVRDPKRARAILPTGCQLHRGDIRDREALRAAMTGCDAVYFSLAPPFSSDVPFDPDCHGVLNALSVATETGVRHVLRLSALGVDEGADEWWVAKRKSATDRQVRECGIPHTLFRADWLMETLPQMCLGRFMIRPNVGAGALWWLAGADYGEQVANALEREVALNRTYVVQGPEAVPFQQAADRFLAAYPKRLFSLNLPDSVLESSGKLGLSEMEYLRNVIAHTRKHSDGFHAEQTWRDLGKPTTTLERYAVSIKTTGDFPSKPLPSGKAVLLKHISGGGRVRPFA